MEKRLYMANGANYTVDGKHVILKPSDKERAVAAVLCGHYGKAVELVPQILYPQGIQTPEYLIDGKRFDLKCFKCFKKSIFQICTRACLGIHSRNFTFLIICVPHFALYLSQI